MYLLDTNIVSEIRKISNGKANKGVVEWFKTAETGSQFISTITLFELQKGVLLAAHKNDFVKADALQAWLDTIRFNFTGRTLPVNKKVALYCAALHIPNPKPAFDSLIAATALAHDLTLVTRNTSDFENIPNLRIVNPFI